MRKKIIIVFSPADNDPKTDQPAKTKLIQTYQRATRTGGSSKSDQNNEEGDVQQYL